MRTYGQGSQGHRNLAPKHTSLPILDALASETSASKLSQYLQKYLGVGKGGTLWSVLCVSGPTSSPRLCEMKRNGPLQLADKDNGALRMQQLVLRGASSPAEMPPPRPRPGVGRVADLAATVP